MPAPNLDVDTPRHDPYKNYRFKVKWDNRYVAGISRVGGLTTTTQVVRHRAGGDPGIIRVSPGQTEYGAILLERGVSYDMDFEIWANKVWDYTNSTTGVASPETVPLNDFRKDITIEVYDEAGQKVIAYTIFRCWVSGYRAVPELDGLGNAIAIQSITLENEGWERDASVTEASEPGVNLPSAQT